MRLFNFDRLIKKYSTTYTMTTKTAGSYVDGVWQDGAETKIEMSGAILPMNVDKIYASNGAYTTNDRTLYSTKPLGNALDAIFIYHEGTTFKVEADTDAMRLGGFMIYTLKAVSKYDRQTKD